jgi:hypothetical protein
MYLPTHTSSWNVLAFGAHVAVETVVLGARVQFVGDADVSSAQLSGNLEPLQAVKLGIGRGFELVAPLALPGESELCVISVALGPCHVVSTPKMLLFYF